MKPMEQRLGEATQRQREALEKLVEALQLLDNRQSSEDQDQSQNQNQDQNQDTQQNQQQPSEAQPQPSQNMNAAQMLQAIRDREAQRRDAKRSRAPLVSGGVEKDW